MSMIRRRSRTAGVDETPTATPERTTLSVASQAPPAATFETPRVVAAIAPKPADPEYDTIDAYPSMRALQANVTLSWPIRMNTSRATIPLSPSGGTSKSEVRRVWVEGQRPPLSLPLPAEHALAFLNWLRDQPVLAGNVIPASDLKRLYLPFCTALALPPWPWQSVARQLRQLTGGRKLYRRVNGSNMAVYLIAPPDGPA